MASEAVAAYGTPLVLDLSGVTFMDASGVSALLAIRRRALVLDPPGRVELRGARESSSAFLPSPEVGHLCDFRDPA